MTNPYLSIIIPAHNEEDRLPTTLEQVYLFLQKQAYTFEVVVVENGSRDKTLQIGKEFSTTLPDLRIIHLDKSGKGRAIREGIFATSGEFRFIADADLSMPVEEINLFLPPACTSDIAIASREAPGSIRFHEPSFRHFTGRVFNFLIRNLLLPDLNDTQCGFKCFRGVVAEDIFRFVSLTGWSFDVEVLKVAQLHGWQITEVPIHWHYFPGSKVNILRDSLRMFFELFIIRRNAQRGVYDQKI